MSQGVYRASVLYNFTRNEYVLIEPQTTGGAPNQVAWTWVSNPNDASKWVNVTELQYYLTDTPLGDPTINQYPWEVRWFYFLAY